MKTSLRDMQVGDTGTVAGYEKGSAGYRERLMAMGLTRGTEFRISRIAPMGDPVELQVRGFNLTLRRQEASALLVETGGIHE
nr:FeoA family protein [uncultured Holophaga sp.]